MSRRDSRSSIAARQNDALLEFENFKKKYLLANKHITKLNSTLSLKIEELNAQISSLYVENLRLRASEICLASQLKREREKCQQIVADAEAATMGLLEKLGVIRKSQGISSGRPPSPQQAAPQPLLATRLPPRSSPLVPRLSRTPSVSCVLEDPEHSSCGEESHKHNNLPAISITQTVLSAHKAPTSRLPTLSRAMSPPPNMIPHISLPFDDPVVKKKKLSRRQSGLMSIPAPDVLRPASPACGETMNGGGNVEAEVEIIDLNGSSTPPSGEGAECQLDAKREKPTRKSKEDKRDKEPKIKSRSRDADHIPSILAIDPKKMKEIENSEDKLKDVTNSPRRAAHNLPSSVVLNIETTIPSHPPLSVKLDDTPQQLPTPISEVAATPIERAHNPLPAPSGPSNPEPRPPTPAYATSSAANAENAGIREKRTRKSVNYAEPKLNTKMRKPEGFVSSLNAARASLPGSLPSNLRTTSKSTSAKPKSSSSERRSDTPEDPAQIPLPAPAPDELVQGRSPKASTKRKRLPILGASKYHDNDDNYDYDDNNDDDEDGDADAESDFKGGWVNISGRRKSTKSSSHLSSADRPKEGVTIENLRRHSIAV